jgi:PAS domain S-box-containing protein
MSPIESMELNMAESPFEPDLAGLTAILENLPELVLVLDEDGTIRYLNRTEPGYTPSDFVGMPAEALVHEEHRTLFYAYLERLRETGQAQEYEINVVVEGEFERWYRTRMLPFGDLAETGAVLMVSNDITEEKALEAEAARLRRLLPLCSWCGRIRDESGEWSDLPTYIARREKTTISHGICPNCSEEEFDREEEPEGKAADGSAA